FPKLDLKEIGDKRRGGKQAVSINGKLGRLVIYQEAYRIFEQRSGLGPVKFVQLLIHANYPNVFWIRACNSGKEPAARGLHTTGETKVISAKKLIAEIGKDKAGTEQFYADWDPVNEALYVDLSHPF
ncbi:MAG: hypothetical protein ACLP5H_06930, partial [Desulfomonilaceae bacterium]